MNRNSELLSDYIVYCGMYTNNVLPMESVEVVTHELENHLDYIVKSRSHKAVLVTVNYNGDLVDLWFPNEAVKLGNSLQVEDWFLKSFNKNLDAALEKLKEI